MTERLYYQNALLLSFQAIVLKNKTQENTFWVCLDQTAFYPTAGGQPYDTGVFVLPDGKTVSVTDVEADEEGNIWHAMIEPIPEKTHIEGRVDQERRLDHMQQHGGEHLLAGALYTLFGGVTRGLHTGKEESSIDVSFPDGAMRLTEEQICAAEAWVNDKIRQNVEVRCFFPDEAELKTLPLRKQPTVSEHVRIVQYGDFEYCPCGGTHPPQSGMIGSLKILSALPSKGKARVSFVCGLRAEKFFRELYDLSIKAGALLSCAAKDVPAGIEALSGRLKDSAQELKKAAVCCAKTALQNMPEKKEKKVYVFLPFGGDECLHAASEMLSACEGITFFCAQARAKGGYSAALGKGKQSGEDLRPLAKEMRIRGGGTEDYIRGFLPDEPALREAVRFFACK